MPIAKYIIIIGIIITLIGILVYFFGNIFSWFGNLPGDIKFEKGNTRVYFPITSMVIITIVINIIIRIMRRI